MQPQAEPIVLASGPAYWFRSYLLMARWELVGLRLVFPIMVVAQMFMGAGLVIGFGLLFDEIPRQQAFYLSSGGAVIALLVMGFVMVPQMVAQQKMARTYDFLWSLPVPRVVQLLASLTVYALVALPGMVLALIAANLRYDLDLTFSPLLIPASVLTILTACSVGFALAHAIPHPMVTTTITQVLVFLILIFAPINFPAERLPDWLAATHRVLPFEHSALVMRAALTDGTTSQTGISFLVLTLWAVAGWIVTWRVVGRRR